MENAYCKNSTRTLKNVHVPATDIIFCGTEKCKPLHSYGPNVRSHTLIVFVHKGRGIFKTKDTVYRLGEGGSFFVFPGEMVFYQADETDPWEYYWIAFTGSSELYGLEQTLLKNSLSSERPVHSTKNHETLSKLYAELIAFSDMNDERATSKIISLFFDIIYQYSVTKNSARKTDNKSYDLSGHLPIAVEYIKQYYKENISVTSMAEHLGISREHLCHLFKKHFGISPIKFITQYRLQHAVILLESTDMKIYEISHSCGFSDYNYFSNLFRKNFLVSPTAYRAQHATKSQ